MSEHAEKLASLRMKMQTRNHEMEQGLMGMTFHFQVFEEYIEAHFDECIKDEDARREFFLMHEQAKAYAEKMQNLLCIFKRTVGASD